MFFLGKRSATTTVTSYSALLRLGILCAFLVIPICVFLATPLTARAAGTFRNPIGTGADPFMVYYNGNYYLTNTQFDSIKMWISPSIAGLLTASPITVWADSDTSRNQEIWAPAFFQWNDHWYMYYTADDGNDASHRMYVLESSGNDPAGPYSLKARVYDPANDTWAIDGMLLNNNGSLYFIYSSHGQGVQNSLYIAPMSDPWTISGPRTYLPAAGTCTEVREAPATLQRNGRIFLVYSVCDTGKPDYHLEMATAQDTSNLLDPNSWVYNGVRFQREDGNGIYGPGSCSFFKSPDGTQDWMVYHAKNTATYTYDRRTSRAHQIGWRSDGSPELGVPDAAGAMIGLPSGDPGMSPVGLNDTDTSPGTNYFEFQGNWNSGGGCGVQCYYGNDHWSNVTDNAAVVHFYGTQVALLSVADVGNGIAGMSIDGGPEMYVDYYASIRQGEQLQYVTPVLPLGDHTLRIRVTGTQDNNSGAAYISIDRAEIYS